MGRIGMSRRELRRVEVLARVKSKQLKVVDAASLVGVSYRQGKRLWKRYREEGAQGLKHRRACESASQAREVSSAGDEAGAGEVRGRRGRAIWADSGGRTFGERRRDADRCGDAAAMDAVGRAVEPTT